MASSSVVRVGAYFGGGCIHEVKIQPDDPARLNIPASWKYIGDVTMNNGYKIISRAEPFLLSEDALRFAITMTPVAEPYAFGRVILRDGDLEVLYGPVGAVPPTSVYIGKAALVDKRAVIIIDCFVPREDGTGPRDWNPRGSIATCPALLPQLSSESPVKRPRVETEPCLELTSSQRVIDELMGLAPLSETSRIRKEILLLATTISWMGCELSTTTYMFVNQTGYAFAHFSNAAAHRCSSMIIALPHDSGYLVHKDFYKYRAEIRAAFSEYI